MHRATTWLFAGMLPLSIAAAQQTWIVDQNGGGNFTDLPAAHDAAAHGDTLLLNPGTYTGLDRSNGTAKAVRMIGAGPSQVSVIGGIELTSFPWGYPVVLSGMTVTGGAWTLERGIKVSGAELVIVRDVVVTGGEWGSGEGATGLCLSSCSGIVDRVTATGGDGALGSGLQGGHGAYLANGNFAVSNCAFQSGGSGMSQWGASQTRAGCHVVASICSLDETSCTTGAVPHFVHRGLLASGANCYVTVANYTGQVINTLTTLGGASAAVTTTGHSLVGPPDLPIGQSGVYTVHGPPGSVAALCFSLDAAALQTPLLTGASFLAGNTFPVVAQFLTMSMPLGRATASLTVPSLASLKGVLVYGQVVGGWSALPLRASGVSAALVP